MATVTSLGFFPNTCLVKGSGGYDYAPIVTLRQAMALFWVVKGLKVTVSFPPENTEDEPVVKSAQLYRQIEANADPDPSAEGQNYIPPITQIKQETDLVKYFFGVNADPCIWISYDEIWDGSQFYFTTIGFLDKSSGRIAISGNDKTVRLNVSGGYSDADVYMNPVYGLEEGSGYSKLDIKSFGVFTWPCWHPTAEVTVEATGFWEYDPLDGKGPKYDKRTGAILRTDI